MPAVHEIQSTALIDLRNVTTLEDLERWRIFYLGRKGRLTLLLRSLSSLEPAERREIGGAANQAKTDLEEEFAETACLLKKKSMTEHLEGDTTDVTLPGWPIPKGGLHPTTRVVREICSVFTSMGFQVMEGPEVELDHYNFQMLNIPKDHPARDMWNSLWIDYTDATGERPMLLRPQTSPMQVRIMENQEPPIRVVVPGKCYRYEATDATHEWQFYQVEGLAVDKGITFAQLKGTLHEFAQRMFGENRRVRFRCDYFPFVEPGAEMSIDCLSCEGTGCRTCHGSGWIEIMGAGMVHPEVLKRVGYDPTIYTGFAFGMGPERIAILKHGIEDIRLFYSNDIRFLRQFS